MPFLFVVTVLLLGLGVSRLVRVRPPVLPAAPAAVMAREDGPARLLLWAVGLLAAERGRVGAMRWSRIGSDRRSGRTLALRRRLRERCAVVSARGAGRSAGGSPRRGGGHLRRPVRLRVHLVPRHGDRRHDLGWARDLPRRPRRRHARRYRPTPGRSGRLRSGRRSCRHRGLAEGWRSQAHEHDSLARRPTGVAVRGAAGSGRGRHLARAAAPPSAGGRSAGGRQRQPEPVRQVPARL